MKFFVSVILYLSVIVNESHTTTQVVQHSVS